MIPDETPDYSELSLREMRSLAQRMNRTRHAINYAYLLRAIEKREAEYEAEIAARPKKASPPFYTWIFKTDDVERTSVKVLDWWAQRFSFWIYYVTFFYFSGAITTLAIPTFWHDRTRAYQMSYGFRGLMEDLFGIAFLWAFLIPCVGIVYWLTVVVDVVLHMLLRFLGWRLSIGLFAALLSLTVFVAAWPIVGLLWSLHK